MSESQFIADSHSLSSTVEIKDDNHIYYNAIITTPAITAGGIPTIPAYIQDTRNLPVLIKPNDFEMSIVRFEISSSALPIAILPSLTFSNAVLLPPSPALTIVSEVFIGLSFGGNTYLEPVITTPISDLNTPPYGAYYSYQQLLDDINLALGASFALIPSPPANSSAPVMTWNPDSQLIELWVDNNYLFAPSFPPTPGAIEIWMNANALQYLSGFTIFSGIAPGLGTRQFRIEPREGSALLQPAAGLRVGLPALVQNIATAGGTSLYKVEQQAKVTPQWNPVKSLQITSGSIPFRPENSPTVINTLSGSSSSAIQPIITDFIIPSDLNLMESRISLEYLPTAEYRMVDLLSDSPLYTLDFRMSWVDSLGNIYQVLLPGGGTFSVKVLFRRKGVTD